MIYPWQQTVYQQLIANFYANKLHHAILFTAPQGVGKAALAYQMASFLLCQQPLNGVACGHCKSCHLLSSETHSDILKISPSGNSIGVDEVRKITQFCQASCMHGDKKVVLIEALETMTESAANALLKTLEEPNAGRYMFLLAEDTNQLSATVLSRCLKYSLVVDTSTAQSYIASLNIQESYPWLRLFEHQPLLIQKWHLDGKLVTLNKLYLACNDALNGKDVTDELKSILSTDQQFVDVMGIFLNKLLNLAVINKELELAKFMQRQHMVTEFIKLCRLAKGTNFQLQCQSFIINLQK